MLWRCNYIFRIVFIILCLGAISGIVFLLHGTRTEAASVNTSVTITVCGNGVTEGSETCDDGNTISGDGCSSICQTEGAEVPPGDTIIRPPTNPDVIAYYTRVILEGRAYPDAKVIILKDGQFLTTTKADSQANFRIEIKDLTFGTYTFGLWAEDRNGLRSPTFTVTFYVASAATTTVSGVLLPPTIKLSKDVLFKGESLDILGQAVPNGKIDLFIYIPKPSKEVFQDSAITDSHGNWYYLFDTTKLKEGTYEIKAKAISKEGLISIFSKTLPFETTLVVSPKPPVPPEPPVPPIPPTPPAPPIPGICPNADLNKDGRINFIDFSIMLYWWGRSNDCADQDADGVVDLIDFSIMMYWWTG